MRSKILDWAIKFEGTLNQDYPPESGFATFDDEEKFEQNGVEIWKYIISHFANEYDKVFFNSYRLVKLYSDITNYRDDLKEANTKAS